MSGQGAPREDRFQISLRTLLIVLIGAGVGAGLLGRMFFHSADLFQAAVGLGSSVLPFLLAIGTIFWIGVRTRRKRLVAWGGMLLAMPLLGWGLLFTLQYFAGPSPGNLGVLSTRRLIDQQLPNQIDQPWVWNELQRRLQAGSLSPQEVDDAVRQLTAHMTATRPQGWDQPLSWQSSFLTEASQADSISDRALLGLCDAFYGPKPLLQPLPRIRAGASGFDIMVHYGSTWGDHTGLALELVWEVGQPRLDGKPLDVRQLHKNGEQWWGRYEGTLPAGQHELVLDFDCAYIERAKLIGLDAGNLPTSGWPKPTKQWKQTITAPLKVYSAEEPIVRLATDPAWDPLKSGSIRIDRFVVQTYRDGKKKLILQTDLSAAILVPLSFDVSARLHDQSLPFGGQWSVNDAGSQRSGSNPLTAVVETLDPDIRQADILFTPNPRHIEHLPEVSEIWGKQIILRGVPLERLDLETIERDGA